MKKILFGFLIACSGFGSISYGKTEYPFLNQLPAESTIKNTCENIDKLYWPRSTLVSSACFNLNEVFSQLDDLVVRKNEFTAEDILAKKQEIRTLAIPIFVVESAEVINKEKEILWNYMEEKFGTELITEMKKYSSSYRG